jgi:DNA topoisomerase-1
MSSNRLTKKKCIAMIIRMVMVCYFRIGNKRYQELYGSFGAMNIQKKHVKFKTDKGRECMFVSFSGKKGVTNSCYIYDKQLIKEMKELVKFREDGEMIFQYLDGGIKVPVRATDINIWLKSFDENITSKDFRTYDANIFLILFLREQKNPAHINITARKKIIVKAMKDISEKIHNTPAILRKNYTQGGMINMFINEPEKFNRYFGRGSNNQFKTPRAAFIGYLRDYCKDYSVEKKVITKAGGFTRRSR